MTSYTTAEYYPTSTFPRCHASRSRLLWLSCLPPPCPSRACVPKGGILSCCVACSRCGYVERSSQQQQQGSACCRCLRSPHRVSLLRSTEYRCTSQRVCPHRSCILLCRASSTTSSTRSSSATFVCVSCHPDGMTAGITLYHLSMLVF